MKGQRAGKGLYLHKPLSLTSWDTGPPPERGNSSPDPLIKDHGSSGSNRLPNTTPFRCDAPKDTEIRTMTGRNPVWSSGFHLLCGKQKEGRKEGRSAKRASRREQEWPRSKKIKQTSGKCFSIGNDPLEDIKI